MNIDAGITNNIIKLAKAWDKAQEISTKIETQLTDYKVDLGGAQICVAEKMPIEVDRTSVMKYLQGTVQAIEHDKILIMNIYQMFSQQQPYINEIGIMSVSQLLNNLVNLDKELVKMSKIVSDVLLNWENLDFNKESMANQVDENSLISSNANDGFSGVKLDDEIS